MSIKNTNYSLNLLLKEYKNDFSKKNIIKFIHKHRIKFLIFVISLIIFAFYEGFNYFENSPSKQAERIGEGFGNGIKKSLKKFTEEDLNEILHNISTLKTDELKEFSSNIIIALKNGENITHNLVELKKNSTQDKRTPDQKKEDLRELFKNTSDILDKANGTITNVSKMLNNIPTPLLFALGASSKVSSTLNGIKGIFSKTETQQEITQKKMLKFEEYVNKYSSDWKESTEKFKKYEPFENTNNLPDDLTNIIGLVFKIRRIKQFHNCNYGLIGLQEPELSNKFSEVLELLKDVVENYKGNVEYESNNLYMVINLTINGKSIKFIDNYENTPNNSFGRKSRKVGRKSRKVGRKSRKVGRKSRKVGRKLKKKTSLECIKTIYHT